jgi:hypothetical protein
MKIISGMDFTPSMQKAIKAMQDNGGKIVRKPGGVWVTDGSYWHKTVTVEALVTRGAAEYTEWKEGKNGRFPIEATLKASA